MRRFNCIEMTKFTLQAARQFHLYQNQESFRATMEMTELSLDAACLAIDFTIVSDIYGSLTGLNFYDGSKLEDWERSIAVIGIASMGTVSTVSKAKNLILQMLKHVDDTSDVSA